MNTKIETTKIGKNFILGENSIVRECASIGDNTEIRENCVIGCLPFTFTNDIPYKRIIPKGKVIIGNNVYINAGCDVVQASEGETIIEDNVIMGQRIIIGHESHIFKNVRLNNSVVLNGYVTIGEGTILGSGANVRNRINIGKNTVIGMGSVVVKDIPDNVIAYGNPCKVHSSNTLVAKAVRKITKEVKKVI